MVLGHTIADPQGHLLAVDSTVCEIMQRSERELLGMSYAALTHAQDRARNVDLVERLGVFEGPARIRKRYVRPDGSLVWSDVRVSRLAADGVDRLVGTIRLVDPAAMRRGPESLWRSARRALTVLRLRRAELGDDLFADHAWIILLQLYLAEAEGRILDLAALADGTDSRPALVDRWLRVICQKALVERPQWPGCAAQLTPGGVARIETLLEHDDKE